MKRFMAFLILTIFVLMPFKSVFAVGESTVVFLLITPSARNSAMGEGGVALVNDPTAIFWNPAGLAFQYEDPEVDKPRQISFMHAKWLPQFDFSDLYYDYLAGRWSVEGLGTFGASMTFLNLGTNYWTDELGTELGQFESYEMAFSVAYATKLDYNLSVGLNAKLIQSNLAPNNVNVGNESGNGSATAFAVDLGMLWTPSYGFLDNRLNLGFNLSNFGPKVTYINKDQADPLPTNLRLGLAYKVFDDGFNQVNFIYDLNRMLVYKADSTAQADNVFKAAFYSSWVKGDFIKDRVNSFAQSIGFEYKYGELIAIRTGYFYEDPRHGDRHFFTAGAGLTISILNIDISYIAGEDDHPLNQTTRFSLGVKF